MPSETGGSRLVLVTGLAGAGRATCLRILEDLGFEAVDNLPLPLLELAVEPEARLDRDLAIGIDSRTRGFDPTILAAKIRLMRERSDVVLRVIFMDADDEVLRRRFTETRRRHPLGSDRSVADGVRIEREVTMPLREEADLFVDTSALQVSELRRIVAGHFEVRRDEALAVTVLTFGFRNGLPREADFVLDMRFLANPHYVPELRPLTGREEAVRDYVVADPSYEEVMRRLEQMILLLLPLYRREGKSYLTVAIGCTGGRHRSVVAGEDLARRIRGSGWNVALDHRELGPDRTPAEAGRTS